ncbi:Efflux transporter [Oleispira antarctica RB-8]|uniref:Efflux transporter n=1 Tax=Oleispira antarctica RB-8 TaxID=698738 RepID=R4YPZ5_OLEAN|nr:Efflux transporter [Oleispira antarctica RB-8]
MGILLIGGGMATIIYKTAPKPQRGEEVKQVRLVETTELKRMTLRPEWLGGGEVSAAQRVQLSAQVAGRIFQVEQDAIPGATLVKNQKIATIEKQDYRLQVQQQQAAVIQAQATLDLEKGQGQLAKEEYELAKSQLNSSLKNNDLVLRKPQIAAAMAGLKTAQANLALAQLQLDRTDIRMPFNGQIVSRSINNGSQVNMGSMLFDLVSTDEFWLQVKVPQDFLAILDATKPVIITSGDHQREADVLHALIEVDATDRQAKILISIKNPDSNVLLIGSYVDSLLFAKTIADAYVVENKYIKDDGKVWVVNDKKLYKRTPKILYQSREKSWIESGFLEGDSLLNSSLGVVTEGTQVRISAKRGQDK